jgi:hypothetical protein
MVLEVLCRWGSPTKVLHPQPPGWRASQSGLPEALPSLQFSQPCPRLRLASHPSQTDWSPR